MHHDEFAARVSAAYHTYAAALTSLYMRTRLAGAHLAPRVVVNLQTDAEKILAGFLGSADAMTTSYLQDTTGGALVNPAVTAQGASFIKDMRRVGHDNIRTVVRRARGADIGGMLTSEPEGALRDLLRRAQDTIDFTSRDSAGRTWKSPKLVSFLARDFGYQTAIDASASRIAEVSDTAQVAYPNPEHPYHGLILSLSGADASLPSLESTRHLIFHPNASAKLTHVRPNV